MNEYDIRCTFDELKAIGHTRFTLQFERRENGVERFKESFSLEETEQLVDDMHLVEYCGGEEQIWEIVWIE